MAKKILLVEDEAILALTEARMLEKHGFEVATVYTGENAIETVENDPDISLILMDIDLGTGMDGTEAAESILERHDLPIAFLSSHTEPEIVEKTEGITSYGYIVKNSGETVLLASIKMAFRLYDAHIELKTQKEHLRNALIQNERTEEELLEKSEELDRYFTSSLDLLCIADTDGRFLRLNPEWENVLGYSTQELEGHLITDFVHPDDKEATLHAVSRLDQQEEVLNFENRYQRRDGSYRWIEWRARPIGRTIYAVARDITERKRVEHEVRESEEKFRTLMNQTIDMLTLHDLEGNIVDVNEQAEAFTGYTRDELLSMSIPDLDPDYREREDQGRFWQRLAFDEPYRFEARLKRKDDSLFFAEIVLSKVSIRGQTYIMTLSRDITERNRREKQVKDSERNLRTTLNSIGDGVIATDSEGNVTRMNPVAEKLCGWNMEEAHGRPLEEVFHIVNAETREKVDNPVRTVLETGKTMGLANHTLLLSKDGQEHPIADSAAPITDDKGTDTGVVLVFRDVADQYEKDRRIAESEKRYRTLFEEMLDGFALHEIITDEDGTPVDYRFLSVNPAFERMTGLAEREIRGKTVREVLPGTERHWIENYGRVALTGGPVHFENYASELDKHFKVTAFRPAPNQFASIFQDVTVRKRAEDHLQQERRRLAEIIEATELGTWEWNVQTGEATFNERWAEIVGYTLGEIASTSIEVWERFAHPEDLKKSEALLEKHFRGETDIYECEARMKHKDGSWVWVLDTGRVFSWTAEGKPLMMRGTHQDITARKQIEAARKHLAGAARELNGYTVNTVDYQRIAENMRELCGAEYVALNVHDPIGRSYTTAGIAGAPEQIERGVSFLGFDILGTSWEYDPVREKKIADNKTTYFENLTELAAGVLSEQVTSAFAREFNVGGAAIVKTSKDDRVLGDFTLLFKDVREVKNQPLVELYADMVGMLLFRLETERRNAELVGEKENLLKEVQHRIKNTMNTMVSMLSLEAEALQEYPEAAAALSDAQSRFRSMEILYDQLYRTESHDRGSTGTYVTELVDKVVELFPAGRTVTVETDIDDVSLEAERLSTLGLIVNELVTNAMKHAYRERSNGKLSVRLNRRDGSIVLSVADDGPGFPEDSLRADGSVDAQTGSSFGLSMVGALAEQLGATIYFEQDAGTRAVLEFLE